MSKCPKTGKTKYRNPDKANKGLAFIFRNDPNVKAGDLHIYRCPFCKALHVGHVKKKEQ